MQNYDNEKQWKKHVQNKQHTIKMSVHVRIAWRQVWNKIKQETKIILQTELTIENFPGQIKYKQVACDNLWTY